MQGLTLGQSADIMQSGVVAEGTATIALHTATGLGLAFQHQYLMPRLTEQGGTLKTAEATAYHYQLIRLHAAFWFGSRCFLV